MSCVAILRSLLIASDELKLVVPEAQIKSGVLPIGIPIPALALTEVVQTEIPRIDGLDPILCNGMVQVSVFALSYPQQKQIMRLVRRACNYKNGVLAGFETVSVTRESNGPDFQDTDSNIFMQTITFSVVYYET